VKERSRTGERSGRNLWWWEKEMRERAKEGETGESERRRRGAGEERARGRQNKRA
jgi:hypothetical protein